MSKNKTFKVYRDEERENTMEKSLKDYIKYLKNLRKQVEKMELVDVDSIQQGVGILQTAKEKVEEDYIDLGLDKQNKYSSFNRKFQEGGSMDLLHINPCYVKIKVSLNLLVHNMTMYVTRYTEDEIDKDCVEWHLRRMNKDLDTMVNVLDDVINELEGN